MLSEQNLIVVEWAVFAFDHFIQAIIAARRMVRGDHGIAPSMDNDRRFPPKIAFGANQIDAVLNTLMPFAFFMGERRASLGQAGYQPAEADGTVEVLVGRGDRVRQTASWRLIVDHRHANKRRGKWDAGGEGE
jgi:hypothetical protein